MQQRLFAALLLHPNRVIGVDDLIEILWRGRPPTTALAGLQGRISHLRRALGPEGADRLAYRSPGYLLRVDAGELDTAEFQRFVVEGRQALAGGDAATASHLLRSALALWRGPALHGVEGFDVDSRRFKERRLAALEDLIEADLRLGRHADLVTELTDLADFEPFRERLHGQLMLALYRCGRQADTHAVFRHLRERLVAELGVEPSPPVQSLYRRILAADPILDPPSVLLVTDGEPSDRIEHKPEMEAANALGVRLLGSW